MSTEPYPGGIPSATMTPKGTRAFAAPDVNQRGSSMTEYSFASVRIIRSREGRDLAEDYREIIRRHATEGWEFVQAIPLEKHKDPRIELVFTRSSSSHEKE